MSDINDDQLPSIEDYSDNSNELPSVNDFLIEQELPSVSDFIEEKEEEEIVEVEEIREEFVEDRNASHDLNEVLHLINSVRNDIPDIPEIKYYDEELGNLLEEVEQVRNSIPEVKYYDEQIEKIENRLDLTDQNIDELPEVKYYEEDINFLQTRIDSIKKDISNLPEVKYYEEDIESLKTNIQEVLDSIPVFPKWVNEVNEVPDFSWIGKTFSVIDDDFIKVQDNLNLIQGRITTEIRELSETVNTKEFEAKVDIKGLTKNLEESKNKIYKELKEYSSRVWDHRDQFKDDDRKLKKQLLGEHNKLKQKLEKDLKELNDTNIESQNTITSALTEYFNEVKEDISNLPEVKYYDKDIQNLGEEVSQLDERIGSQGININELYKIVEKLKKTQENLKESTVVSGPNPSEKQRQDPLTPIDQDFDTLAKLAKSYKLFTSRVQTQLYTMGGGGAAFIKDLDDVTFDQETGGNKLLIYAGIQTGWIGISSDDLGGGGAGVGGTWAIDSVGIHTIKSVGIGTTADSSYQLLVKGDGHFTGNISAAGTVTFEDVKHIDAIGVSTFRDGIIVQSGVTTISSGIGTVYVGSGSTTLIVDGDARITGILTIGTASITLDPNAKTLTGLEELRIGSGATAITIKKSETTGEIEFADLDGRESSIGIGTTVSINTTGIITATSFVGDGSDLTGVISGIGINTSGGNVGYGITLLDLRGNGISSITTPSAGISTINIIADGVQRVKSTDTSSGITTTFTIAGGYTVGSIDVYRNGVHLVDGSDFTATNESTVDLLSPADDGDILEFIKYVNINLAVPPTAMVKSTSTSSGITTTFTISGGYTVGTIDVYLNGSRLIITSDFTATDGSTVDLISPAQDGDTLEFVKYNDVNITGVILVDDTTPQLGGNLDINSNNITGTGNVNITGKIEAPEIVTSGTTGAFYPPVLTTTQRNALSGITEGAMIFNTSTKKMEFYNGSSWQALVPYY